MHSVVWLHDAICEADVTDEPGTGNYVPSVVPDVPVVRHSRLPAGNALWFCQNFLFIYFFFFFFFYFFFFYSSAAKVSG